jgi:LytS/YehU family sensor histidine kinase
MLDPSLLGSVIKNIAVLGVAAYITTQLSAFRRTLKHSEYRMRDKLVLMLVFGFFSGIGNFLSISIMDSLANTRIVGAVVGGLLGGPLVGVGAGLIGGIPRYFMGGFTMPAAVMANMIAGCIGGIAYKKYGPRQLNLQIAFVASFLSELVLKFLVIVLSEPMQAAIELERVIALPTIAANSLGVMLFIYIVRDVFKEQERVQAESAQQAMRVITQTSNLLKDGLTVDAAVEAAKIIFHETKPAAVAITDGFSVLAFVGQGEDHHFAGTPIMTETTKQVVRTRQTVIANTRESVGCPHQDCPLTAVVDTPMIVDNKLQGTIKLYKANNEIISPYEAELIQGIADFLSLQLMQHKLDEQAKLLAQAEYNMLKAQVNPHFLFNTLGTIRALARSDAETTRALIKNLSDMLRKTLNREREIVSLDEEMETVRSYVNIEKARFGSRVMVYEHIPPNLLRHPVPVFSIQPLVENAIRHGLSPKIGGGTIKIEARYDQETLYLTVSDNGVGISPDKLSAIAGQAALHQSGDGAGIGVHNVHSRLQKIYGKNHGLTIASELGQGTSVTITLPLVSDWRDDAYGKDSSTYC